MKHQIFIVGDMDSDSITPLNPIQNVSKWVSMGSEFPSMLDSEIDTSSLIDVEEEGASEDSRKLSLFQTFKLRLVGNVCVGKVRSNGWREYLSMYAFRCSVHGVQFNYPSGWKRVLKCPQCFTDVRSGSI